LSILYKIAENGCFLLNKLPGGGAKGSMSDMFSGDSLDVRLPRFLTRGTTVNMTELDGFSIHRIQSRKNSMNTNRAVLFLPGGGGMARATRLHYDTAKRIADKTGAEIIIANYPLAPGHNVVFALDWLEKLYSKILEEYDPQNIVFMGDSAGANLILSLTYRVNAKPGGLIVISPACGLENGKNRDIRKEMEPYDPILSVAMNDTIAENWCRNVPLDSPDISPEYINHAGFPPMLMFYGSHELFYPHVKNYIRQLESTGVNIRCIERPMCHDWALCSFFKEGREAIAAITEWINSGDKERFSI